MRAQGSCRGERQLQGRAAAAGVGVCSARTPRSRPHPTCTSHLADSKQTLVSIGDKGRSQLTRAAPDALTDIFQDTYKVCGM